MYVYTRDPHRMTHSFPTRLSSVLLRPANAAMTMARMPVQHRARLREHRGLERRPVGRCAAQVHALWCGRDDIGIGRRRALPKPGDAIAQAKEDRGARTEIGRAHG